MAVNRQVGGRLEPGSRLGSFEVRERIGAGGQGEVYRARDVALERDVALKVLPEHLAGDAELLERFQREARLLASLSHPRLTVVHGLLEHGGVRFLVLELVHGETLAHLLERGRLPFDRALRLARQIAEGLEAAHAAGVIHRDLKPGNVMVLPDGGVKLLDFGLAKAIESPLTNASAAVTLPAPLTEARLTLGTPAYMSPEQWRGGAVDRRADVWAFGVVLYEMLAGTRPFGGASRADVAAAALTRDPDWGGIGEGVPAPILDLLRRCLERDPARRPSSMGEVRERLADAASAAPPPPTGSNRSARDSKPTEPSPGLDRSRRRRTWLVAAGAAFAAVAAAVALLPWLGQKTAAPVPIDSLVVLPFENASTEPDGEYLSDGISQSLTNSLSRLPGLRVIPRGIAWSYKGRSVALADLAEELDVRAVVTGRVAERDGELVVNAELVDAGSVSQLWGEQYRRPSASLLDVQEQIVREIADALRLELTAEEERRATDPATENPEAYRLYLKTNFHSFRMTPEDLERAVSNAEEAVELDPRFALGWVALSQAHMSRAFIGRGSWTEAAAICRAAAERAIDLDPSLAAAWVEKGFVEHHFDWDWSSAERSFARAVELDPTLDVALQGHSESLASLGRVEEALARAERAVAMSPLNAHVEQWLAFTYHLMGRHDEALAANARAREIEPDHALARSGVPLVLLAAGRHQEAIAALEDYLRFAGTDPKTSPRLAAFFSAAGNPAAARDILARIRNDGLDEQRRADLAIAYGYLGEPDRAFALLEGLVAERSRALLFANTRPSWSPLRGDPRFDALLERMGLPRF